MVPFFLYNLFRVISRVSAAVAGGSMLKDWESLGNGHPGEANTWGTRAMVALVAALVSFCVEHSVKVKGPLEDD
jgi:hypothetical protein